MITTTEILKKTGLSYPQFNRLRDLGIIPKPILKGRGGHEGVIGMYDDQILEVINWVKKQRKNFTLLEIAEKWREFKNAEQVTGELVVPKPNPDPVHWRTDLFAELDEEYPLHAYGQGKLETVEELPNGKLRVQYLLSKKPKEK